MRTGLIFAIILFLSGNAVYGWEVANPLPLAGNIISVSAPSADTCWVADDYGGISMTTDGGESWTPVVLPEFLWGRHYVAFQSGLSGWVAEPRPWGARCYSTTDGGESWRTYQIGNEGELFNLVCLAVDSATVIVGGNPGDGSTAIYRLSQDRFLKVELPQGSINDISIINRRNVWAVGAQGYCAFSADGGANWQRSNTGVNITLNSVVFTSNLVGWVGGGHFSTSLLLKTTNGGGNWSPVGTFYASSAVAGLARYGASGLVAVSKGNGDDDIASVLVCRDGTNWESVSAIELEIYAAVDATNAEIWAVGQQGLLMHSTDGRNVAPAGSRLTTTKMTDISFFSATIGWAVGKATQC